MTVLLVGGLWCSLIPRCSGGGIVGILGSGNCGGGGSSGNRGLRCSGRGRNTRRGWNTGRVGVDTRGSFYVGRIGRLLVVAVAWIVRLLVLDGWVVVCGSGIGYCCILGLVSCIWVAPDGGGWIVEWTCKC